MKVNKYTFIAILTTPGIEGIEIYHAKGASVDAAWNQIIDDLVQSEIEEDMDIGRERITEKMRATIKAEMRASVILGCVFAGHLKELPCKTASKYAHPLPTPTR